MTPLLTPTPEGFKSILRSELRARGIDGAGIASIKIQNKHAILHWLWQGKACELKLDRLFGAYMDGRDYLQGLRDQLDRAFFR